VKRYLVVLVLLVVLALACRGGETVRQPSPAACDAMLAEIEAALDREANIGRKVIIAITLALAQLACDERPDGGVS
jgi:hypothetical protein